MEGAYFVYGLKGIKVNENNEEILDIEFGRSKFPLNIFKKDIIDFIRAVIPAEELEERGITEEKILKAIEEHGIEVLNELLEGRAIVLITDFYNYFEYINAGQNQIRKITTLNIDGEIEEETAFDYGEREPGYYDLYPPETRDSEFEEAMEMLARGIKGKTDDPKKIPGNGDDDSPGGDNR